MNDRNWLKYSFDEVAILYNAVRPRYPEALFSTLINTTGISAEGKLLEIGAGTGQATKPLAEKGFQITAIEPGPSLTEVAKSELGNYPNVQLVNSSFEETDFPQKTFDLVYAATSFHWIDPEVKYTKTHQLLKDGGHLAVIHTNHISDEQGDEFFNESQPIYDRYNFSDHPKPILPKKKDLVPDEIDEELFKIKQYQLFPMIITYTARNFASLLNTYSNHLKADKKIQHLFYGEIEELINRKYKGKIDKHFAMSLMIAQKI